MSKMTRDRLAHIDLFPSSPGCWRRQRAVVRGHSGCEPSPSPSDSPSPRGSRDRSLQVRSRWSRCRSRLSRVESPEWPSKTESTAGSYLKRGAKVCSGGQ